MPLTASAGSVATMTTTGTASAAPAVVNLGVTDTVCRPGLTVAHRWENEVMDDFDAFVEAHGITGDEMGAAFAAWLSGSGWDGNFRRVAPTSQTPLGE